MKNNGQLLYSLEKFAGYGLPFLLSFAHAPYFFTPLFPLALVLFWRTSFKSSLHPFLQGMIWSGGYFLSTLSWIRHAFVYTEYPFLGWLAILGLALGFSIYGGMAHVLSRYKARSFTQYVYRFCIFYSLFEWIRGHAFTGFPWALVGYIWESPWMLLSCRWMGIYGLSFLTLLAIAWGITGKRWRYGIFILFIPYIATYLPRIHETQFSGIFIRLVQPSISQDRKWSPDHAHRNLRIQVALSQLPADHPLHIIIWPEASLPFDVEDPHLKEILKTCIPEKGYLITGGIRRSHQEGSPSKVWNSLFVWDATASILSTYDKAHLVPFGEYIPLSLPLNKITHGVLDFSKGVGRKTISLPEIPPFSPLICYEAIFPGDVVDEATRPEWILNLTNDAWYGRSSGPYQHLHIVRVRAIETGLPVVRVANNGISAVIDSYGQTVRQMHLDDVGVIDGPLPLSHATSKTKRRKINVSKENRYKSHDDGQFLESR